MAFVTTRDDRQSLGQMFTGCLLNLDYSDPMKSLTDFADQAVILPIVTVVAIASAAMGWKRGTLAWLGVTAVTFAAVLAAKVGFLACHPVFGPWEIEPPSGHVAAAAVVAGGLMALLGGRRMMALGAAVSAASIVGVSRLVLGAHSLPEVLIGSVLGVAGAAAISYFVGPPRVRRPVLLLTIAVFVALLLHGAHLPAEPVIRHGAHHAFDFVAACRADPDRPYLSSSQPMSRPAAIRPRPAGSDRVVSAGEQGQGGSEAP